MEQFLNQAKNDPDLNGVMVQLANAVKSGSMNRQEADAKAGEYIQKYSDYKSHTDAQGNGFPSGMTPADLQGFKVKQMQYNTGQPVTPARPAPQHTRQNQGLINAVTNPRQPINIPVEVPVRTTQPRKPQPIHQTRLPAGAFPLHNEEMNIAPRQPQNLPEPPPKGLLQQGMEGLQGAGKATQGYFDKLFNDPSRMALLQGGLSMMDPNSYYDKDGYGSLFTGLNRGLGSAQAGAQGVFNRQKTVADRKLAQSKIAAENAPKVPKNKAIPVGDGSLVFSDEDVEAKAQELMSQGMGRTEAVSKARKIVSTMFEKGLTPQSQDNMQMAYERGQLNAGVLSDALALAKNSYNTGLGGALKRVGTGAAAFFSFDVEDDESTQLANAINDITAKNWKSIVGSGGLTESDKKVLRKVIHTPESLFTSKASVVEGIKKLQKALNNAQRHRARTLGIDLSGGDLGNPGSGTLSSGESVDGFLAGLEEE
jgi:hypothetical protein